MVGEDIASRVIRDLPTTIRYVLGPHGRRIHVRAIRVEAPELLLYHCHILDHEDEGMMAVLELH